MENIQEIAKVQAEVQQVIGTLVVQPVTSKDEYAKAGDVGKMVSNKIKELNEKRLEMTRPLDTSKKLIMAEFDKLIAPLERFVNDTKAAMLTFHRAEEARIAEERRKELERQKAEEDARRAREEAEKKAAEEAGVPDLGEPMYKKPENVQVAPAPLPEVKKTVRGDYATATAKANWQFEVLDPDEVPRQYCEPSKDHIRQAIAAGTREIKGVRIYDAGTISLR